MKKFLEVVFLDYQKDALDAVDIELLDSPKEDKATSYIAAAHLSKGISRVNPDIILRYLERYRKTGFVGYYDIVGRYYLPVGHIRIIEKGI